MRFLRFASIASVVGALAFASTCVSPGGVGGILYNDYTGPYQTSGNPSGSKVGQASVTCYAGLVCVGDAGIAGVTPFSLTPPLDISRCNDGKKRKKVR